MLEKIPLEMLYLADCIEDDVEQIHSNSSKTITVVHRFYVNPKKTGFILLTDSNNRFVGYMNIENKKTYNVKESDFEDCSKIFSYGKEIEANNYSKSKRGYINFEPLKNYDSKYIKPYMTIKNANKAVRDINIQRAKNNMKDKILSKVA